MKHYSEGYKSCSLFGAMRYFSGVKDSVCLIHGPQGCAFYNRNAVYHLNGYNRSGKFIPRIFTTSFSEDDVIFGGMETLLSAIDEIVVDYSPKCIFLFNCCVTEVIGEDIDGIAKKQELKYGIRIIVLHSAGFKGDHKDGFLMACDTMFREFCTTPHTTIMDSVNILGEFNADQETSKELRNYLGQAGIRILTCIPSVCTIDELNQSTSAMLNIVYCGNAARRLALHFENIHGIPFVGTWGEMYGSRASKAFYDTIFNFFEKPTDVYEDDYRQLCQYIKEKRTIFDGKKAIIVSGMKRALGYGSILRELGIDVRYIYSEFECSMDLTDEFAQLADDVDCNLAPEAIRKRIDQEKPDFLFSTLTELVAPYPFVAILEKDYEGFSGMRRMIGVLEDVLIKGKNSVYVTLL